MVLQLLADTHPSLNVATQLFFINKAYVCLSFLKIIKQFSNVNSSKHFFFFKQKT